MSHFPPGTFDLTEKPVDLPQVFCCSMYLSALHKRLSEGWKQNRQIQELPESLINIYSHLRENL